MRQIPKEALYDLRRQLEQLPPRSPDRKDLVQEVAELYGASPATVYRSLRGLSRPKSLRRSDHGTPRILPKPEMERYCEIIAALKIRTRNKKGRHISTSEAIRLLEQYGLDTPDGLVRAPKSRLKPTTVNRYLAEWGYDPETLGIQQTVTRFQATHSNECWQFDLSPSDLKHLDEQPAWASERKGRPILMLYSVVDDRSGVSYQEYHLVYGEDVGAALRFLFNAMSPQQIEGFPFQGIPQIIYMDNGPIAKSRLFRRVMEERLGIELRCHEPRGKGGRRTTSRSKGKVERPFRTVKEVHETLYHFHKPSNEEEANTWLMNFLLRYNAQKHRTEEHSRLEDWLQNLPPSGLREMCSWERFCSFAREPESRTISSDARASVDGVSYQVDEELTGQEVVLWLGIFDDQLYVEFEGRKFGPYQPVAGPIPLNRYRSFRKTEIQKRAEKVEELAAKLALPREALTQDPRVRELRMIRLPDDVPVRDFEDPDPFNELRFSSILAAKRAIASSLGFPLARLGKDDLERIDVILNSTLVKVRVMAMVKALFNRK